MTRLGPRTVSAWRAHLHDLQRYATCGVGATITDYAVWWVLTARAAWPGALALLVSRPAGGLISFFGNRHWTWRQRREWPFSRQFRRFWAAWLLAYAVAATAAFLYAPLWPDAPLRCKAAADLTAWIFSYLAQRYHVFR